MPRQANGAYLAPANTAAVSGQSISSTAFNTLETDIGTEITNSLDRQGRAAMQAALPMGGFGITGLATPVNPTDATTKAYVDAAIWSTGDIKPTLKIVPDTGWVFMNDGSIGSAGSGSTTRANADTQALFNLLFSNCGDTDCPVLTSGGGATTRAAQTNAATAWAANCRMTLPLALGRAMGSSGNGAGLTHRNVGGTIGEETHLLTTGELPTHNHGITEPNAGAGHQHVSGPAGTFKIATTAINISTAGATPVLVDGGVTISQLSTGLSTTGISINNSGGGGAHNVMQPSFFVNMMIKL